MTTKQMSTEQMALVQNEVAANRKSKGVTWVMWLLLGGVGGHRFYMGDTGRGVAMLLLNWLTVGIWGLLDAFFINGRLAEIEREAEQNAIIKVKAMTN